MSADAGQPVTDPQPAPDSPAAPAAPWLVPVARLSAHPGNVREDLSLSEEFCASVAAGGVRVPLLVTPEGDGYRVIEGHRRLAAAVKTGQETVPCALDASGGDLAEQFLDMAVANSDGYRRNFTPAEEAAALFSAREAGATKTRIRRVTGRTAAQVGTALAAGGLAEDTRRAATGLRRPPSLEDLALLAEFDGDADATAALIDAMGRGYGVEHTAERIRQDRAEAAAHAHLVTDLQAAGVTITAAMPDGAALLSHLLHDGGVLDRHAHAQCPGRGAYFQSWNPTDPVWYCASPAEHGHAPRYPHPAPAGDSTVPLSGGASPLPEPPADADRRLVIEGNRAWVAAAGVRRRWVKDLLARRSAPREVMPFLASQLLAMPQPLRTALPAVARGPLFSELTGHSGEELRAASASSPAGRLPLLALAPVATAYEQEMCGEDLPRRSTWREGRFSPCPRPDAGTWLTFLASLGYELSPIEQAVADGTPYTGDTPDDLSTLTADPGANGTAPDADAAPDDTEPGVQPEAA